MPENLLYRNFQLREEDIANDRSITLSFSSEEPVRRLYRDGFVWEVLDHGAGSVDLSRLQRKAPFLIDHNPSQHPGVVERVAIGADRRGMAVVRLSKNARATELLDDMRDGIRPNVSVAYDILDGWEDGERDGLPVWRFKWRPYEISSVSIPGDTSVGVGRAFDGIVAIEPQPEPEPETQTETPAETIIEEKRTMPDKIEVTDPQPVEDKTARRQRDIEKMTELADKHDAHALATSFIRDGKSLEDFCCAILERNGAKPVIQPSEIGLTRKEQKQFSMVRALNALANPESRSAQEAAGFERECSDAACKQYGRDAQGILIPNDVLMSTARRDLTIGTAADGGYLKGTDHLAGSFIDALRNRMMVMRMGARMLDGLVGDIAIPKLSAGATAYWVDGDSTTGPTESKQTFAQVTMAPKTVGAMTDISRKLLKQSSPSVDMLVEQDLQKILAIAIDAAALHGTGSTNKITGIAATSGIGSVAGGTNGLAPTWAHIVSLWSEVAVDNADIGSLGFLTNAKVIGKLMTTEKASNTAQ